MVRLRVGLFLLFVVFGVGLRAAERHAGPWDLAALKQTPQAEFGKADGGVHEIYYAGEPLRGKPTRIFAYYAVPQSNGPPSGTRPFPAMLCVHGGGGKAFREWAELWAARGYVALAMDLGGKGPDGAALPDAGPDQTDVGKFNDCTPDNLRNLWSYHAVAAVIRGHSLLASRPEVDRDRIGITGISWGGYLTCIVAGLDDRLKCAVPVYGCGFLGDNSTWLDRFAKMPSAESKLWLEQFDPSQYLGGATCPMLFVNGTNDFAYPLDSYQKSYRLPRGPVTLCIRVGMPHGHPQGWAPVEIGLFVDSVLKGGKPLPRVGDLKIEDQELSVWSNTHASARFHYTVAEGPWQKREWKTVGGGYTVGTGSGGATISRLPPERPIVIFGTITDDRGALVGTPHVELK